MIHILNRYNTGNLCDDYLVLYNNKIFSITNIGDIYEKKNI